MQSIAPSNKRARTSSNTSNTNKTSTNQSNDHTDTAEKLIRLERVYDRLQRSHTELASTALFLAKSMGFTSALEAQNTIELAGCGSGSPTYAEYLQAGGSSERKELEAKERRIAELEEKLRTAQTEYDASLSTSNNQLTQFREENHALTTILNDLRDTHTQLQADYTQLAEVYRKDSKAWAALKAWLFKDTDGEPPEAGSQRSESDMFRCRKIKYMQQKGDLEHKRSEEALAVDAKLGITSVACPVIKKLSNKPAPATPQRIKRALMTPTTLVASEQRPLGLKASASSPLKRLGDKHFVASSPRSPFSTPRRSRLLRSPRSGRSPGSRKDKENLATPTTGYRPETPSRRTPQSRHTRNGSPSHLRPMTGSSDTEDESQPPVPLHVIQARFSDTRSAAPKSPSKKLDSTESLPVLVNLNPTAVEHQYERDVDEYIEDDDADEEEEFFALSSPMKQALMNRPKPEEKKQRHSDIGLADLHARLEDAQDESGRRKLKRHSDAGVIQNREEGGSAKKKRRVEEDGDGAVAPAQATPRDAKGKGKAKDGDNPIDYSVYKGRGRYAKSTATTTTINQAYAINPATNDGAEHQFHEVVRGKQARKTLDAGDCEECRAYYEAIGPLPARLQPPLWASPKRDRGEAAAPVSSRKDCSHRHKKHQPGPVSPTSSHTHHVPAAPSYPANQAHNSSTTSTTPFSAEDADSSSSMSAHRQAISRHRAQWERSKTPPAYWEIGFPSTQEVEGINEKAAEMHREKMREVEKDVRGGKGRWVRRT